LHPSPAAAAQAAFELLKKHPFALKVNELAYWKQPVYSAEWLASLSLTFYLLTFGEYTILTLSSYVLILLLVSAFLYTRLAPYLKSDTTPFIDTLNSTVLSFNEETIHEHVAILSELYGIIRSLVISSLQCGTLAALQVAAIFFVVAQFGKLFSGLSLLWLITIVAFTAPKIYQEKHAEIDRAWARASSFLNEQYDVVKSRLTKLKRD